jgi:hypothetical protein
VLLVVRRRFHADRLPSADRHHRRRRSERSGTGRTRRRPSRSSTIRSRESRVRTNGH